MNLDILIIQPYSTDKQVNGSIQLSKYLKNKGLSVGILFFKTVYSRDVVRELNLGGVSHWDLDSLIKKHGLDLTITENDIKRIKKTYDIYSLRNFCFTSFVYAHVLTSVLGLISDDYYDYSNDFSNEYLIERALLAFNVMELFLSDHDVQCFYHTDFGGEIVRRVIHHIAEYRGIPSVYPKSIPFLNRFSFTSNEHDILDTLELVSYADLNHDEIDFAKKLLYDFRNNKLKYSNIETKTFFTPIKSYYREQIEPYGLFSGKSILKIASTILRFFHGCILKGRYSYLFDDPDYSEDYYLFPVHFHCESLLTFRNQEFWRQEFLVEYISRLLPLGCKLYVKLHPFQPYSFPMDVLHKLKQISNIKIINSQINTHQLIKKSKGVIVIASTVGFESLLLQQNVICAGKVFYRGLGLTTDLLKLDELPQILSKSIQKNVTENEIIELLCALIRCSYIGNRDVAVSNWTNKANMSILGDALVDYLLHLDGK
jgi:hypothetical protein